MKRTYWYDWHYEQWWEMTNMLKGLVKNPITGDYYLDKKETENDQEICS